MAQGMHADITNILASKRLEKRRRAISEKRRKRKSKKYYIPVKPLISNHLEKGWQNSKFPHIFHIFSPSFLPIFSNFSKWQKWNVSITGQQTFARTLSRSKPLFARMNSCCAKNAWFSGCTASASTNPVPGVAMSLKHLIYDISCVCVLGWISQPYVVLRPVSGIWASQSTKDQMPQQDLCIWTAPVCSCKNKGWDGETKLSSRAPPRPQTASLKTRDKLKQEEVESVKQKKRLYKLQPLRQQKSIAIWPSASEHRYNIHEAKRHSLDFTLRRALWSTAFQRSLFILLVPTAILQREGFWQHKGLGKHNAISVASSILTCNGLATLKGSPPGCKYRSHLNRKGLCWAFPSWWPHLDASIGGKEGLIASWTSLCFLHYKQLCWASWLTTLAYPLKPWTHRTCCWQGNSAD